MANTYGGSSKRQKFCYDNDGIKACNEFFSVTNLETNKTEWHQDTTVRLGGMWGLQGPETSKIIGIYDPKTKKFTPNENATAAQATYFTSPEGTKQISNNTIITNTKSAVENGKTPEEAQQQALEISEGNYSHPTEDGENTTSVEGKEVDKGKDITNRKAFGDFIYPLGLSSTEQDIIKITMMEYVAPGLGATSQRKPLGDPSNKEKSRSIGTVILPIPGGIKDDNKVEWGENSLNAVEKMAASFAMNTIKNGTKGADETLTAMGETLRDKSGGVTTAIATGFVGAAIGKDFKSLLGRQEGQILNPNMELLFNAPTLRPFDFTFLLAPRSKKEAQQVIGIIRFFKQGMAVKRSNEGALFLQSPNTFQLTYKHRGKGGSDHPYLNKFKECALRSCSVNYTPENSYSTYDDGVLTAYSLSLSFQELTPIYSDDYEEGATEESLNSAESFPAAIGF